ncbi:dTDP-4-dehydrorhamnose 3,5-epimerase family protein [Actinoallomurus sp. CA-150999]|uniref:dTDP-4-dehydrorhamnose 3,5-epimerase family protein n=1 Tax=Actinoallomurus sp. CA-150999 TaxID=3239887 RepID=UPI003D8E514C
MEIHPLEVPDSFLITPRKHPDLRGCFYESFRSEKLSAALGRVFQPVQVNYSVSRRGVLRGIHSVLLPPGQAKMVTCHRGMVLDMVVDLRLGSPTFGRYSVNRLDADSGASVFIAEGLGHAFLSLADDTCVGYLCSTPYVPGTPLDINPFDPALGLPWELDRDPVISAKDASAPTVAEAAEAGLLPTYDECRELYGRLAVG